MKQSLLYLLTDTTSKFITASFSLSEIGFFLGNSVTKINVLQPSVQLEQGI